MGIFHCHVTRGVSLTSKNDWRNASALSCVEVFFGLSMVGSFWTNMLNLPKKFGDESQVDSHYPWVGGKKKTPTKKTPPKFQKSSPLKSHDGFKDKPFPWKSKTKQRMVFRMIHVKDSLLPLDKVWSLDFLGISFFGSNGVFFYRGFCGAKFVWILRWHRCEFSGLWWIHVQGIAIYETSPWGLGFFLKGWNLPRYVRDYSKPWN